jgi:DNA primase
MASQGRLKTVILILQIGAKPMQKDNWVDYKEVKAAVSMEMVLDRYGVAVRRVNKTYLRGKCPLPTHASDTSKESFGVQTEKNTWACQSQSCVKARGGRRGGNVLDFVAVMESCTVRDAALKLQNWFMDEDAKNKNGAAASPPELVAEKKELVGEHARDEGTGENRPLPFALKGIDSSHPYLSHRGITRETAEYFGVGFFSGKGSMSGRIVIPIHNAAGDLVAYAGRALDEAVEPRYKFPAGFNKSLELFNLHRAIENGSRGVVIVVEGFFDAMKIYQAGFPSVVALMGSSLSDVQAEKLGGFDKALLMLDADEAGVEATPKIIAQVARHLLVRVAAVPQGKQPDLLSSEDIERILEPLY